MDSDAAASRAPTAERFVEINGLPPRP
jgi:hypothetical protein